MPETRFRTRAILIAAGRLRRVYSSPAEVPPDLRRPLEKALGGELTATIVIADERGRAEALERLRELPPPPPRPAFPYAREAVLAGLLFFFLWALATLR